MAEGSDYLWAAVALGSILFIIYLYVGSIEKVLVSMGFTHGEASTIIFGTVFLGWVSIPLFPYDGWWVGISLGGALIPLLICVNILWKRRIDVAEAFIGITIVAFITYNITRAEDGVGIVADFPIAFAPALAAGLYSLSVFWMDIRKAAPLAYVSGIIGTLVGADVFRLGEALAFDAPSSGFAMLSIGGANIFDMVYFTGIVAVIVALILTWMKHQQKSRGYHYLAEELPLGYGPPDEPRTKASKLPAVTDRRRL